MDGGARALTPTRVSCLGRSQPDPKKLDKGEQGIVKMVDMGDLADMVPKKVADRR
jgi:hypothetical protein